jgi:ubiquitin C-terminal hydrolase
MTALMDKLHEALCRLPTTGHELTVANAAAGVDREAWLGGLKGTTSVVSEVFRGQLVVRIQGVNGTTYDSKTHDHFTCLSLGVTSASTLMQCVARFMDAERVEEYNVGTHKGEVQLSKRFTYLPRILIIHLKRFGTSKIERFIEYPAELNLSAYAAPRCHPHYQLFSVCAHHGASTDSGHYSACGEVKGSWYRMDDDSVSRMENINDIVQRDAYILLYKRLGDHLT